MNQIHQYLVITKTLLCWPLLFGGYWRGPREAQPPAWPCCQTHTLLLTSSLSISPHSALPEKPAPFQYPLGWPPVQELPPSLQAPPPGGWPVPPNLQWG